MEHEKFTIAALRVRMDYTQEEAAELLGMTRDTLRKFEQNSESASFVLLEKMAALYRYPLNLIYVGDAKAFAESLKAGAS